MAINPEEQWRSLTALYGEMGDLELRELADGIGDLTETAAQVLRDELKRRGMTEKRPLEPIAGGLNADGEGQPGDHSPEYTWKTLLCECDESEAAWQIREVLRRAGIESWVERPGSPRAVVWDERTVGGFQVLVAADRLDHAREIAAQPIPQEIIELSTMEVPEYQPPVCPACGASDPVLLSADPVNTWECEACETEWTEASSDPAGEEE